MRRFQTAAPLLVPALLGAALAGCTSSSSGTPAEAGASESGPSEAGDGAEQGPGSCVWPATLNEGGPGACSVGRAYVECIYSAGVICDGGPGASGPSGITQLCLSDDPTRCSGCLPTSGTATCTSKCTANEYAVSCGGPPIPSKDGGLSQTYQGLPDGCAGVGATPGGNEFACCPCE